MSRPTFHPANFRYSTRMDIAIIDYGVGNLRSAEKAFQHLGLDAALRAQSRRL